MHSLLKLVLGVLALTVALDQPVLAQDEGVAFAVTYIEVTPSSTERDSTNAQTIRRTTTAPPPVTRKAERKMSD